MALILVDVDGTLLRRSGSEPRFALYLFRHGLLGPKQIIATLWFFVREVWRYGRHVGRKNKAYLCGLEIDKVKEWGKRYVQDHLVDQLRPVLLKRLAEHAVQGDYIILLTGTPDFIAGPLADKVGAHMYIATYCNHSNGRYTDAVPPFHPFNEKKVAAVETLCHHWGLCLNDCTAYGDSHYDLPLLRRVAKPVVVHPNAALAAIAHSYGWEMLEDPLNHPYDSIVNQE